MSGESHEIKKFFFEASVRTYAADAPKGTIVELPGSRVYTYERGPFRYVDTHFWRSPWSFGQATIWYDSEPRWWMQYHGWSRDKRVHAFLKRALLQAHEKGAFNGGRGPEFFHRPEEFPFIYFNRVQKNDFGDFEGEEEIRVPLSEGGGVFFRHAYRGMALA